MASYSVSRERLMKIVLCGLIAALSYVVFTFLQIKISLPGGDQTSIHLGNAVCVLGALLLGGLWGGIGGALGRISKTEDTKHIFLYTLLASIAGLLFNVIFDPLVGYFYKLLILGKPAAELTLAWNIASTSINAITSVIVSTALYMALRPAMKKAHLLPKIK